MTNRSNWKAELETFFDTRGAAVSRQPTLAELCYIAGRDPRLWSDVSLLDDLKMDLLARMGATARSDVLEVGCAGGFLARLVAPEVAQYTGVDLAERAVTAARRLNLANAQFLVADGGALPFPDARFDAAFCYDVFTNFPTIEDGAPLVANMLRVVKPGGCVLIGSIPDGSKREAYALRVAEVSADLERRYGPSGVRQGAAPEPGVCERKGGMLRTLLRLVIGQGESRRALAVPEPTVVPRIVTYEFNRSDFSALAMRLGATVELRDIHALNPYFGFRFNAMYRRSP